MDLTKLIKTTDESTVSARHSTHVLFATSEVAPFSKTGGLGDVAASLPKALSQRGHHISIVTPLYGHLDPQKMQLARRLQPLVVPRKAKSQSTVEARVWEGRFEQGVRIFFIDCEEYFGRPGIYGYDGETFEDNAERFAFFSRAVVEFIRQFGVPVDVLHCNDWHTALAPLYLQHYYKDELSRIGTVITLHNAAYQGSFDQKQFNVTGLPRSTFLKPTKLQHDDTINFLKGGIVYSDYVTAVSPTYTSELKTDDGGFGLHELFQEREDRMVGILNGADYSVWSPERDHHLAVRYDAERLNGKRRNKAELQHEFGLPVRPLMPLLGFVGRLAEQKGLDLLIPTIRTQLKKAEAEREGFQVVFLGEGDAKYHKALTRLTSDFPTRVAVRFGYDDAAAHRIFAGVDILLVPSAYEPCGLTQIYAMRYGTLPVVHATGGLADTVSDASDGKGTGFVFEEFSKSELGNSIERAIEKYRHHRQWRPLMINAMSADFSWSQSAREYEDLYLRLVEEKTSKKPKKKTAARKNGKAAAADEAPAEKSTKGKASKKADDEQSQEAVDAAADASKTAAKSKSKSKSKSTASKKSTAKKSTTKKSSAKESAEKKSPAKKTAAKKSTARKATKSAREEAAAEKSEDVDATEEKNGAKKKPAAKKSTTTKKASEPKDEK